jgi:hypothetical protein
MCSVTALSATAEEFSIDMLISVAGETIPVGTAGNHMRWGPAPAAGRSN